MKHFTLTKKLKFPSFDISMSSCKDICEYGTKSRLCYALNNPRITVYNRKKSENNEKLLNSKNFVSVIKKEILLSNYRKFRFFAFGDIYKIEHLEKIETISKQLPSIKFWLSTHNDRLLDEYFKNKKNEIPNLNIVLSCQIPNAEFPEFLKKIWHERNIMTSRTTIKKKLSNCHASIEGSSCDSCENCFNKMDIIYFLHGKYALKRLKEYEKQNFRKK